LLETSNADLEIRVYHGGLVPDSPLHKFSSRHYKNYSARILGFSFVIQPRLMVDVLQERPAVVVVEGAFGTITNIVILVARRIRNLPTIIWTAGWSNPAITGVKLRIKSAFERAILRLCAGAIVYGTSAVSYLSARGVAPDKIVIAQNTVDVEDLIGARRHWHAEGQAIRQNHAPAAESIVAYVGQLSPLKRVKVLLEAFSILQRKDHRFALLIVGDGEQRAELMQFVASKAIAEVHFLGDIVQGVEAYFAAADVFVLPGTGGLALNQAMALGLPVIATVADGTQDDLVIPGDNGYLVPVDDAGALERSIREVLASPDRRMIMGARSLQIVQEKAPLKNMVAKYSAAIHQVLAP
jgi:glycosyltransferase involved in cell wall biosynthesis